MRRREGLGLMGAVPAFPISALAQPSRRIVKIGHMESGSPSGSPELLGAFREQLREFGYVEGQNLFVERRYAGARSEHLPTLAAELVRSGVDLIFAVVPPGVFWTQDAAMRPPVLGRVRRTIRAWSAQGCDRHSSPAASARCSAQRRPGPRREPPRHCGKAGPTRPAP